MRKALLAYLAIVGTAHGQGLRATQPIPGYACMVLNVAPEQARTGQPPVPVLAMPSSGSAAIGTSPALVIATSPLHVVKGYGQVLTLRGQVGWIEARKLLPYRSASDPSARCTPSWMSNGKPGFGS